MIYLSTPFAGGTLRTLPGRSPRPGRARGFSTFAFLAALAACLLPPARASADDPPPAPPPSLPPPEPVTVHVHSAVSRRRPVAPQPPGPATQPAGPQTKPGPLPWLDRLSDGIDAAGRGGQPILVDVGAEWCGWCKQLDREIAKPEVQAKLAGWTRVRLDADRDTEAVRGLSVGPIPALRLLTPAGRVVASQDGYLAANDLLAWLDAHYKQAAALPGESVGGEPADAAAVDALLAKLADPDAVVREAVTRRLLRHPDLAAGKVVDAFANGRLAARLAALELLQEWKAPVDKLDPWDPPTITPERVAALKKWATEAARVAAATRPATGPVLAGASSAPALTPDRLADARRDVAALLQAATGPEALAARERLARFGPALLPEVYAGLRAAATDRDRERLTALRYRLVASDALALNWPGGLDRLASPDGAARHAALDELGARVTPADAPLLSELFADPDPLVREQSLRLLQAAGGDSANGATAGLARLLRDPEPNVRAAVLKQLAETPMPGMDAEVVKYVATEKDADLLVHAVRVLREAKSTAAIECLKSLLGHESWRVRAEAAEALGKAVERNASDENAQKQAADVYTAMVRLLDDPDGYVVGRALMVLRDARSPGALEPMYKAAERRPELAGDVVRALARQSENPVALGYLRKFCAHADPAVRAAAVAGLCQAQPAGAQAEIRAALSDSSANVRLAAAAGLAQAMVKMRPDPDREVGGVFGFGRKHKPDMEAWLDEFRQGRGRPGWLADVADPLKKMLDSGSADEKLAAAVPLVALGQDDAALPRLRDAVKGPVGERERPIEALPWLPWEERLELFNALAAGAAHAELPAMAEKMVEIPDPRAAAPLWELAGNPAADISVAWSVENYLMQLYLGGRNYGGAQTPPDRLKALVEAAGAKAAGGTEMQRVAALALLLGASPPDAATAAEKVIADQSLPEPLRRDAFQIRLLAGKSDEGRKAAIEALQTGAGGDWEMKKVAVRYLALGSSGLRQLRDTFYLNYSGGDEEVQYAYSVNGAEPKVVVKPPEGLTAAMVKPLAADSDREPAACAAYLLTLLGDRSGFDPLVAWWRREENRNDQWRVLVYRAASVLKDDSLVPVLEEVYASMSENGQARFYARDLYWTIRGMEGPNAMKLRKKIRDEVGMDNLK